MKKQEDLFKADELEQLLDTEMLEVQGGTEQKKDDELKDGDCDCFMFACS